VKCSQLCHRAIRFNLKEIESKVLEGYLKVNPSFRDFESEAAWREYFQIRVRIFRDRLHLPPQAFTGADVLDLGSGTGEKSVIYALLGARTHCVDFNPKALEILKKRFHDFGVGSQLSSCQETSISSWQPPQVPVYDFAVSEGLLHHLEDPYQGFAKLCHAVKPGGFVVISLHTLPGHTQRMMMRKLILKFSQGVDEAVSLAKEWFPEFLNRATKFGYRTVEQVVNDNFLVANDVSFPLETILGWFYEQGLSLYRTWPPLEPALTDAPNHVGIDWVAPENRECLAKLALHWAYVRDPDVVRLLSPDSDTEASVWDKEVATLSRLIETGRRDQIGELLKACQYFGRGFAGVGMTWIVGIKH
jgi:SAM-dependent methyltransferase